MTSNLHEGGKRCRREFNAFYLKETNEREREKERERGVCMCVRERERESITQTKLNGVAAIPIFTLPPSLTKLNKKSPVEIKTKC